jgi:hypothetical protein
MAIRVLRGEMLQINCLSSEDLKEENDTHSKSDITLIPHPPHICFVNIPFQV